VHEEGKKYRIKQIGPLQAISPYLVKAVLIGEDDKFWQHEVLIRGDAEAIEKDIKPGSSSLEAAP